MKAVFFTACMALLATQAWAQTVFVVRHAERQDATPESVLSVAGEARAQKLAALLADVKFKAIYTTQYPRCKLTAEVVGKRAHVESTVVPAKEGEALLTKLRAHGKDDAVLVVGHSNTVPEILKGLGYTPEIKIAEDEHDNLFIVVLQASSPPVVTRLRY